jgi:hypothetical protein
MPDAICINTRATISAAQRAHGRKAQHNGLGHGTQD